ncbi:MAG: hypothetical protein JWO99_117 [Candidatus Saccharibacteria bacterium]|nr:hypothetical protein [Candidatus Saccharibacteria bacterium]
MSPLTNPFAFVFAIATTFGVLMHDTQVDHAATVAIVNPASQASIASSEVLSRSNEHVHVEKVAGPNQNAPQTQPRNDDRKYVQSKKSVYGGTDSHGLWPSA